MYQIHVVTPSPINTQTNPILFLQELSTKIVGVSDLHLDPQRMFIRRGPVMKHDVSGSAHRMAFLFSDQILFCMEKGWSYKVMETMNFVSKDDLYTSMSIDVEPEPTSGSSISARPLFSHGLRLILGAKRISLSFQTLREKDSWLLDLYKLIAATN